MPNKTTTDGLYRYAFQGQEKDPETGMEAFELRLWDGRLGRWLTVDPKHQYASPYLGMGNNPISRIDPDGGTDKESPIFDSETGDFLGVDSEGFLRGEVLFMSRDKFDNLTTAANGSKIDHAVAVKNSISIANLPDTEKGFMLFAKATDYISKALYSLFYHDNATDNLFGGKVQSYSDKNRLITSHGKDIGSDIGRSKSILHNPDGDRTKDVYQITMGFDHRKKYLNTAPNIFSLYEHEFYGHGVLGHRTTVGSMDDGHREVYKFQVNTLNFKNYVTGAYRELVLAKNKSYGN